VYSCLSSNTRQFHCVHHVFEICAACDPIQLLGACFRDTVNIATDGGLNARQAQYLNGIVEMATTSSNNIHNREANNNKKSVRIHINPQDSSLRLVLDLFGVEYHDNNEQQTAVVASLDSQWEGVNVLLSAILMTRVFQSTLSMTLLAQVLTGMEASIPFRPPDKDGRTALERLHSRLAHATTKYQLRLSSMDIVQSIQRAADLANRHLGNFSTADTATFLDHTWALLPERSAALRRSYLYTVTDFLMATKDMLDLMEQLEPSKIFQSYQGVPSKEEMEVFDGYCQTNLLKGRIYVRARLLRTAVISAFATLTGGDAPMSFFAGDLPEFNLASTQIGQDFEFPSHDSNDNDNCNERRSYDVDVFAILKSGRNLEQSFDTRNAPLAAYLYYQLGDAGVEKALRTCTYPMTQRSSRRLLESLPKKMVTLIGKDMGRIAISRTEAIDGLLKSLL
jgi:hypothetical protein